MIFYAGKVTLFHTFFISLQQKTENAINYEEKNKYYHRFLHIPHYRSKCTATGKLRTIAQSGQSA